MNDLLELIATLKRERSQIEDVIRAMEQLQFSRATAAVRPSPRRTKGRAAAEPQISMSAAIASR